MSRLIVSVFVFGHVYFVRVRNRVVRRPVFDPSARPIIRVISEIHIAQTGKSKFHVSAAFHVGSRRRRRGDVFVVKAVDKLQRRDLDRAIRRIAEGKWER